MRFKDTYPLLQSTLAGIFSADVSMSEEDSAAAMRSDLDNPEFRDGIKKELVAAFAQEGVPWAEILMELDVGYFESDQAAREFVRQNVYDVVFPKAQVRPV